MKLTVRGSYVFFERAVVVDGQNPGLVRNARSKRAERHEKIIPLNRPLALRHFLFQDIAKQATLLKLIVTPGGPQLIAHAPGDEGRGRNLGMRVLQVLARELALIAEKSDVAESHVSFQIRNS